MARNNDIMDEDFGKEIPEPEQPNNGVPAWAQNVAAAVVLGCVLSVIVALTIRLLMWILP